METIPYDRGGGKVRVIILSVVLMGLLAVGSSLAIEPGDVANGHVWLFEDGSAEDDSRNNLNGSIMGGPSEEEGVNGTALSFDGQSDGITLPDSSHINTGGPWTNRTVKIIFNCDDVDKSGKQTIYEEGGRTRGLVIYVSDGEVYVGAWNRSEYNWNGEWISEPIKSGEWYEVAAILRDTKGAVEEDKFEMWLDGRLIDKRDGGQLHGHGDDNGIAHTNQNTVFHDEDGSGDNRDFVGGMIDEVWILNEALTAADLKPAKLSVEPVDSLVTSWGSIKSEP
jgi:hypothetical protein